MKARLIPFKLISFVDKALDELTNAGVLAKIENSDWVTPIVPVLKADGSIRICGDYQIIINSKLIIERPTTTDELFTKIAGEKKFSKIDLAGLFTIRGKFKEYLTLNQCVYV